MGGCAGPIYRVPVRCKGQPGKDAAGRAYGAGAGRRNAAGDRMERLFRYPADRKSVGTVVCAAYAQRHRLRCRQILFTPVEATFQFAGTQSIVFHGTADPWANTKVVEDCCHRMGIPLYETEMANHSLETGDVDVDISVMRNTMKIVKAYAENKAEGTC